MDICEKHLNKAIAALTEDSETVIGKLVARCGKDSAVPLIMGMDSVIAGIDTTGASAAFLLYHLASNPDKAELLHQEICSSLGPRGSLTPCALASMRYLRAVQAESQRLLPAIWATARVYDRDVTIAGYSIPRGTQVLIMMVMVMVIMMMTQVLRAGSFTSLDPASFPQPEQFLPERWLRAHPLSHRAHAFANLPFGHGARACVGQRFARLELYTLMVKIFRIL